MSSPVGLSAVLVCVVVVVTSAAVMDEATYIVNEVNGDPTSTWTAVRI